VVLGQATDPLKLTRAKQFRREMTPAERMLWNALRRNQIDGLHFRRLQIIAGFIVDFCCHRARLVIEVDGDVHRNSADYDHDRDAVLKQFSLMIVRVSNGAVLDNLPGVLDMIRSTAEKTWSSCSSPRMVPPSQ